MSNKKTIIEIKSPELLIPKKSSHLVGVEAKEIFYSNGHQCTYCSGNGYFWSEDEHGEPYQKECPICKGNGKLNAVITVEWSANKII